jgi:hypothetical protein
MRQIQVADLTASANEIDTRMGPIPGRSSDRIAGELRWAADELQRAMDILGDVPGTLLTERLQNYVGSYMALQLKASDADKVRALLERAREEMVLAIAFLGRDAGSSRLDITANSLIERLAKMDREIRANAG